MGKFSLSAICKRDYKRKGVRFCNLACTRAAQLSGEEYTYEHSFSEIDGGNMTTEELATYLYEEGNYACDCNRSDFINEHCDEGFPEMNCGHTIKLLSLIKQGK